MLRFFRNIRQKLIEQENVRKYIWYAVGEILLVMIGILLALQVNNWNEQRKLSKVEHTILTNMAEELSIDTLVISNNIKLMLEIQEYAEWLRIQLDEKKPYSNRMDTAFAMISIFSINEPNYSVFNNLESIGIATIRVDSVRNEIMHYYNEFPEIADTDNFFRLNSFFREQIYPKYFKRYFYGAYAIPVDKEAVYENTELSVVLDYSINDSRYYINRLNHIHEVANNLLTLVNKELE